LYLFFYQKLEDEKKSVENSKLDVEDELDTLKKEQEDLLVLLADQDTKIDKYKTKLKELGQQVSNKKKSRWSVN
jgi:peptidoglycan hydrolase CwlO-like protein